MKEIIKNILSKFLILKNNLLTNNHLNISSNINLKTTLEGRNIIHKKVDISNSKLGFATYIGKYSELPNVKIGRFCCISSNVKVISGNHPTEKFVSIHPAFFSLKKQSGFTFVKENLFKEFKYLENGKSVEIGNDVWIGANVLIMEGIKIGDGAIIGTGSLVTRDIEPYTINVGVPTRTIRKRFKDEEIAFLLQDKWWNKDISWLKENSSLFKDIKDYIKEKNNE